MEYAQPNFLQRFGAALQGPEAQAAQAVQGLFADPANANLPVDQLIRKAAAIDPAYAKQLIEMEMVKSKPLSPTEQKELFDTTDKISAGEGTLASIKKAKELVSGIDATTGAKIAKPYSGFGAESMAAANRVPILGMLFNDDRATATTQLSNVTSSQALESMKSIFGANPTEGERQILLKLQALPSYTQSEQATILGDAEKAATRRLGQQKTRAAAIERRDYGGLNSPAAPAVSAAPAVRYNAAGQKATLTNGKWVIE